MEAADLAVIPVAAKAAERVVVARVAVKEVEATALPALRWQWQGA